MHRQSFMEGCGRPSVKLTALLIRGAATNGFGYPVGGPLCVHVYRAGDSEVLTVWQGGNDAASVPLRVAGRGLSRQHDCAATDQGCQLRADAIPIHGIKPDPD